MAGAPAAGLPRQFDAAMRVVAARLREAGIEPAMTEARLILELAGIARMDVMTRPESVMGEAQHAIVIDALARRLAGEPVARIRGMREIDGLALALGPDVLEPRDDTLTLIDAVAPRLAAVAGQGRAPRLLDVGTGSGLIAISLLVRIPSAHAVATDIAPGALRVAKANAEAAGIGARFDTVEGDLFAGVSGRFDVVVSNPPYIRRSDIAGLDREVRLHDPLAALDGGSDGLDFYRRLAAGAGAYLADDGFLAVEIGHDQRTAVVALFGSAGWRCVDAVKDLGERDRALVFVPGTHRS